MGGFGSAIGAIVSIRKNRSMTSRSSAIEFYKDRANTLRASSTLQRGGSFKSKIYSDEEYKTMQDRIHKSLRKKRSMEILKTVIVLMLFATLIVYVFSFV